MIETDHSKAAPGAAPAEQPRRSAGRARAAEATEEEELKQVETKR